MNQKQVKVINLDCLISCMALLDQESLLTYFPYHSSLNSFSFGGLTAESTNL